MTANATLVDRPAREQNAWKTLSQPARECLAAIRENLRQISDLRRASQHDAPIDATKTAALADATLSLIDDFVNQTVDSDPVTPLAQRARELALAFQDVELRAAFAEDRLRVVPPIAVSEWDDRMRAEWQAVEQNKEPLHSPEEGLGCLQVDMYWLLTALNAVLFNAGRDNNIKQCLITIATDARRMFEQLTR